jgi:hypothetical protein
MKYTEAGHRIYTEAAHFLTNFWRGFIRHIKTKMDERRAKKEKESSADRSARLTASATFWMAAFTLILALTNGLTIWVLIRGGSDTRDLVKASQDAANAASDQADAAQQFSDTAEDINNRLSDAVNQLQSAADNAKSSIKATQDALRLEQRPWLYISGMNLRPLTVHEPFAIEVWIYNSGKTPGTPISAPVFITVGDDKINKLQDIPAPHVNQLGMIFPDTRYGPDVLLSTVNGGTRVVREGDIEAYNAKPSKLWVYVYGRLEYRDTFGVKHTTSYCAVSNGGVGFQACPEETYPAYAN